MTASSGRSSSANWSQVVDRRLGPRRRSRRRTPASRASSWRGASRSAPARSRRHHFSAKGSRSANSAGSSRHARAPAARAGSRRPSRRRPCAGAGSSTSWSLRWKSFDVPRLERIWVASSVLASWSANSLNVTAVISWAIRSRAVVRGQEVDVALEHVRVVRRRPVVVREVPALAPDQDHEVREQLERVEAPRVAAPGVHARRHLAEVGLVPRAEQAAAGDDLHRLDQLVVHLPEAHARRAHEPVRALDPVVRRLEAGLLASGRVAAPATASRAGRVRGRTPRRRP